MQGHLSALITALVLHVYTLKLDHKVYRDTYYIVENVERF